MTVEDPGPALLAAWQAVAVRMADLPVYNAKLELQTTRFLRHGAWSVGIVVTPWFMNVIAVPDAAVTLPASGSPLVLSLPAGEVEAIVADLDGFGRLAAASLFSPMDVFDDPAATRAVAEAALGALFGAGDTGTPALDRRGLLFGGRSAQAETRDAVNGRLLPSSQAVPEARRHPDTGLLVNPSDSAQGPP
jgi:[NiFe] hydrogenase assembly HybE family chaperone